MLNRLLGCALAIMIVVPVGCSRTQLEDYELEPPEALVPPPYSQQRVHVNRAFVRNGAGKLILTYDHANGAQVPEDFSARDYDGTVTVEGVRGDGSKINQRFGAGSGESFVLEYDPEFRRFFLVQTEQESVSEEQEQPAGPAERDGGGGGD
jgi:hypothetical protein